MRILLKSVAIIIFIMVLLVVLATQLISTQDILNQVSIKVEQSTGRTLTVNGDKNLSVFPSLSLELHDVHFSNIKGGSKQDMASISELLLHIPWLSVFSGELTIEKFVINNPDILLEKSIDGTGNWQFAPLAGTESTPEKSTTNDEVTLPDSFDISLGQVEVNGGKLTFIDHQNKATIKI